MTRAAAAFALLTVLAACGGDEPAESHVRVQADTTRRVPADEVDRVDFAHMSELVDAAEAMVRALASGPTASWHDGRDDVAALGLRGPFPVQCPAAAGTALFVEGPPSRVWLTLADERHLLTQVVAASGARYANDNVGFWLKGDDAMLDLDGEEPVTCRLGEPRTAPAG